MVEKSMFIDKRHSPMIELTKIEARIILYWLELQANAYWRKGGAPKSCDNIEQIYNKLQDLVRNRKTQNKKWRWLEEPKSRLVRQREYNKQYRERQKEAKKKAEQHEHNWVETPFILEKGNRCTVCGRIEYIGLYQGRSPTREEKGKSPETDLWEIQTKEIKEAEKK